MKYFGIILGFLMAGTPALAEGPAAYTLTPKLAQIHVGEAGAWTQWNVLTPGQTVKITLSAPSNLTLSVRRMLGAAETGSGSSVVNFGPSTGPQTIRLSNEKSGAVIHKSKDTVAKVRVLRLRASEQFEWTIGGATGPVAFVVEAVPATPAKTAPAVAKVASPAAPKAAVKKFVPRPVENAEADHPKFFVETRPGFFLGKGTFRGFRGELAAGYIPGLLDGALAFVLQGGYYGASAEQKFVDADIGTITRTWDLTAVPVGLVARYHFTEGDLRPYVAGGFDYTRVSFEYTASIAAGSLQEPRTTGLNSYLGPRGAGGLSALLGPGMANAELALTYSYLPPDMHGATSQILSPVFFASYAYVF